MNCTKCGTELQADWIACPNCGQWIGKPNHKLSNARGNARRTPTSAVVGIAIAIAIFAVIVIALPIYFYTRTMGQYIEALNGDMLSDGSPTSNSSTPPPVRSQSQSWHKVITFIGIRSGTDGTFDVGQEWKISWETTPVHGMKGNLRIAAVSSDGSTNVDVGVSGKAKDQIKEYKPGTYTVAITSTEPYQVEIDDYH